jgi:hypothetical protein
MLILGNRGHLRAMQLLPFAAAARSIPHRHGEATVGPSYVPGIVSPGKATVKGAPAARRLPMPRR